MTELSSRDPLLIVWPSTLNVITLSIVSWSPKQNPYLYLCLDLHGVLFFSFFFSKLSTWSSSHVAIFIISCDHHHHLIATMRHTWMYQRISYHISWQRLVHRFHQLSKTKLGLSTSSSQFAPLNSLSLDTFIHLCLHFLKWLYTWVPITS